MFQNLVFTSTDMAIQAARSALLSGRALQNASHGTHHTFFFSIADLSRYGMSRPGDSRRSSLETTSVASGTGVGRTCRPLARPAPTVGRKAVHRRRASTRSCRLARAVVVEAAARVVAALERLRSMFSSLCQPSRCTSPGRSRPRRTRHISLNRHPHRIHRRLHRVCRGDDTWAGRWDNSLVLN